MSSAAGLRHILCPTVRQLTTDPARARPYLCHPAIMMRKAGSVGEAAMLAHIERHPWNWDRALEAVKVFGVLIAAFWALVQYGNQIEQDRTDAILRAVQVVHDNRAVEFRKDLDNLVALFWVANASEFWDWYNHNGEKPSPDYHVYQKPRLLHTIENSSTSLRSSARCTIFRRRMSAPGRSCKTALAKTRAIFEIISSRFSMRMRNASALIRVYCGCRSMRSFGMLRG